jgi:hypothetical protein
MHHPRKATLLLLALLLAGLLPGCGNTTIEIGLVVTAEPGHWYASYETFSGTKTTSFEASNGQTITLTYDAALDKGTLEIRAEDPLRATIYDVYLHESTKATVQFLLYNPGTYYIVVKGSEASGSVDLNWQIQ